jgi:hypothetical protein
MKNKFRFKEIKMKAELKGSIKRIGSRVDVNSDVVQTVVLEVFGNLENVSKMMQCPVNIIIESEGLPQESQI